MKTGYTLAQRPESSLQAATNDKNSFEIFPRLVISSSDDREDLTAECEKKAEEVFVWIFFHLTHFIQTFLLLTVSICAEQKANPWLKIKTKTCLCNFLV